MKLGSLEIHLLNDGMFMLDGGTMFGMVPKALWQRVCPCDAANRVELRTGVLLIQDHGKNILVDAGMGAKLSDKQRRIYDFGESRLLGELTARGVAPEDVYMVILTHLHLDHAGGCTRLNSSGRPVPVFPRAEHVVQRQEWDAALRDHPLTRGSYIADDFMPLEEACLLDKVDGDVRLTDSLSVGLTGGHTVGHQVVFLESGGEKGVFLGDLIPTAAHLPLPWTMAYDNFPLELVDERKILLEKALAGRWLMIWQHDPRIAMGRLKRSAGAERLEVEPV